MNQYDISSDGRLHEIWVQTLAKEVQEQYPKIDALAFEASALLTRAFGTQYGLMNPVYEKAGLTPARSNVLGLLYRAPDRLLSISNVAAGMNVTPGNVTQVVTGLEKQGLVRRMTNSEDRRGTVVQLTEKGVETYLEVRPRVLERINSLWAGLTHDEKLILIHLLAKLRMLQLTSDSHLELTEGLVERRKVRRKRSHRTPIGNRDISPKDRDIEKSARLTGT